MAHVAVIGGGISGLACAYYLRKLGKDVVRKVTLSERQTSMGGWIQSTCFPDGTLYEHGPNSLRPSGVQGYNTLALVEDLGLASEVLRVTAGHPATTKRLILVNKKLYELPSSISHFFRKQPPFQRSFLRYIIKDLTTQKGNGEDESLDNFARRRFGDEVADFIIDPVCRGISAGSSKDVSVRSLTPNLFKAEQEYGSVIKGIIKQEQGSLKNYLDCNLALISKRDRWASWTLCRGLQQLPIALEAHLNADDGVHLYHNIPCDRIKFEQNKACVHFEGDELPTEFDHVFACIPAKKLSRVVSSNHPSLANHLSTITSVSVGVVNLEYQGKCLKQEGFGYLVPSNQESKLLGVIFNSCSFPEHDGKYSDKTRLTCMLGGKWLREYFGDVDSINPSDLLDVSVAEVGQNLQIQEIPIRNSVKIHKNSIAQYRVGHHKVLETLEKEIQKNSMCLTLTGSSYNGIGVNDCIYNARIAVENYVANLKY